MSTLLEAWKTYVEHALDPSLEGYLSLEELALITKIDVPRLQKLFRSEPWKTKLIQQGLPHPPLKKNNTSLTEKQLRWIRVASNPFTAKPIHILAAEHGVTMEEHRNWLQLPHFQRALQARVVSETPGVKVEVLRRTMNKATQGDAKATENYFRMINEPLPALQTQTSNGGQVSIERLMQVLQRVLPQDLLGAVALELMGQAPEPLELEEGDYEEVEPSLSEQDIQNTREYMDFAAKEIEPSAPPLEGEQ
jgi:hypothetical protein